MFGFVVEMSRVFDRDVVPFPWLVQAIPSSNDLHMEAFAQHHLVRLEELVTQDQVFVAARALL